jgi:outer membrane receptor protein involved in Fe transport
MRTVLSIAALLVLIPSITLTAQSPDSLPADTLRTEVQHLETMVVSATRSPRRLLDVASAASVLSSRDLNRRPHGSVISLLTELPGVDLTGVGPNQLRPVIRGFGGQRILLLEDGLRVNNARRQQDFGELPALIQQQALDRVEVLRGPASVLYGSDAIGGVVNLVGASLPVGAGGDLLRGSVRFRYVGGQAGVAQPSATLVGRSGRLAFRLDGDSRNADDYRAPAGGFGAVTLDDPTVVRGTGLSDRTLRGHLAVDLDDRQQVFVRYSEYRADDAGFGYVDPSVIGPDAALVNIRYPKQHLPIADRVDLSVYGSENLRDLDQSIFVPFGPGTPPGAGVAVETHNRTDVDALGARLEAARRLSPDHLLTWGLELTRDRAGGTDSSGTTVVGFGPPTTETSTRPALPTAEFRTIGLFAQDEIVVSERLSAIVGLRYQSNTAETFATAGLAEPPVSGTDRTVVWAANLLYRLADDVRLVAAASRGFRSPNLVERFYHGVTPEGSGFQARNLDLRAETSVEVDLGIRMQRPSWSLSAFVFRNNLRDGIRVAARGDTVMGFPAFQNVNIERLRVRGVELSGSWSPFVEATLLASYSGIDQQDTDAPLEPVGEGDGSKLVVGAQYRHQSGRFWTGVRLRHQGERQTVLGGSSLVGGTLPGFTVVDIDAGGLPFTLGRTSHVLTATLENVGNVLYAETANAAFFRPSPGRRLHLMWRTEF